MITVQIIIIILLVIQKIKEINSKYQKQTTKQVKKPIIKTKRNNNKLNIKKEN